MKTKCGYCNETIEEANGEFYKDGTFGYTCPTCGEHGQQDWMSRKTITVNGQKFCDGPCENCQVANNCFGPISDHMEE